MQQAESTFIKCRLSCKIQSCLKNERYLKKKILTCVGLQEASLQSVRGFDGLGSQSGEVLVKQGSSSKKAGEKRCECRRRSQSHKTGTTTAWSLLFMSSMADSAHCCYFFSVFLPKRSDYTGGLCGDGTHGAHQPQKPGYPEEDHSESLPHVD